MKSTEDDIFLIWCQRLLILKGPNSYILLAINSGEFEAWRNTIGKDDKHYTCESRGGIWEEFELTLAYLFCSLP